MYREFYRKKCEYMNLLDETKFIMKKYNISANKSLGQNFLINENVVDNIVKSSNINKNDVVIEIGPGLGTLTSRLLDKAGKVICIELDKRMIKILNDRFSLYDNFEIINDDVLKVNLKSLILEEKKVFKNVKVVANLPYYITTPIIMRLLEENLDIESITIMIQKEVADRLSAIPGDKLSGAITYSVYYYAETEKIMIVENDSFIPEPAVDSEVIKLNIRKNPPINVENKEILFKIIKYAFMKRRKTLINALSSCDLFNNKEDIKQMFKDLAIDEKVRGENLKLKEYAAIANYVSTKCNIK